MPINFDLWKLLDAEKRELRTESMPDNENLLPVVQKFFEYDLETAAHILESMTEFLRRLRMCRGFWPFSVLPCCSKIP